MQKRNNAIPGTGRKSTVALALAAAVVGLAACSSGSSGSAAATPPPLPWQTPSAPVINGEDRAPGAVPTDAQAIRSRLDSSIKDEKSKDDKIKKFAVLRAAPETSPCWPTNPSVLSQACETHVDQTMQAVQAVQDWLPTASGPYATLTGNLNQLWAAAQDYRAKSCSTLSRNSPDRESCQNDAYVITQARAYLEAGADAALQGR